MNQTIKIKINNLHEMQLLGGEIAKLISPKFTITLDGALGAGKTTLIRAVLKNMGILGTIKSPTYTLVEQYHIDGVDINHFDLYRFHDASEWFDSGFDEYFTINSICFVEWSSKADILCHIQTPCLLPNSLPTTSRRRRLSSPCDSNLFEYSLIPDIDWNINIKIDADERCLKITALTARGEECLKKLTDHVDNLFA